jgi:hypothetical protein
LSISFRSILFSSIDNINRKQILSELGNYQCPHGGKNSRILQGQVQYMKNKEEKSKHWKINIKENQVAEKEDEKCTKSFTKIIQKLV